ncbi:MAG TPA: hypothetical protein VG097_05185 [Gemmata sp.]|nr:hypothetical protein [Gemmata sp.]
MGRRTRVGLLICLLSAGCATAPPVENPVLAGLQTCNVENPVLVSPGVPTAAAYMEVFEKAVDILGDYFELHQPNPYAGQITAKPRVAPGFDQFWKTGNPDPRSRLLATLQSVRQTATIDIRAGERGGYLVYVVVDKELEDLDRPAQARVGLPVFETGPTVARPFDIVNQDVSSELQSKNWFKIGRDYAMEQLILSRIRNGS